VSPCVACLPASISPELHVLSSSFFSACYLWPWVGPPGGVAIFYLLPVLWDDVMFAHNGKEYATRKSQQVSRLQQSATIASG